MKVILREDVQKLGKMGDVVDVSVGHATNFLLPRKLAVYATGGNQKQIEGLKKRREKEATKRAQTLKELASALDGKSVTIPVKTTEDQKLYGSVGPTEIAAAVTSELGATVDEKAFLLEEHIRELKVVDVLVRLAPEIEATIKVWVVGEE